MATSWQVVLWGRIVSAVSRWDWRLFAAIGAYMLVPRVYDSYHIYLIGNAIPDPNALPIIAQWSFVGLAIEVLQEGLILPLFFFIGANSGDDRIIQARIRSSVWIVLLVSSVLAALVFTFTEAFVQAIGTSEEISKTTREFIRVRALGIPVSMLLLVVVTATQSVRWKRVLIVITLTKAVVAGSMDALFFGGYSFSLGWGVAGAAWSNVLAELIVVIVSLVLFVRHLGTSLKQLLSFSLEGVALYSRVGVWSGIESLVKNLVYAFMIVRVINLIGTQEIGGYYLAMHVIWGFLIVPALIFADSAKVILANNSGNLKNLNDYFVSMLLLSTAFVALFVIAGLFWTPIATFFNPNVEIVSISARAFSLLVFPYVLLIVNIIIDSLFYGTGHTRYLAYQSLATNAFVYGTAFLFWIGGVWIPSFESVLVLFGLGIAVDSVLTCYFASLVLRGRASPLVARESG